MPKRAQKEKEEDAEHALLIDDVSDLAGDAENVNAAFGACLHGVLEDNDCIECRSNSCMGGPDCECASRSRKRA